MIRCASQSSKAIRPIHELPKIPTSSLLKKRLNLTVHNQKPIIKFNKKPRISSQSWIISADNGRILDSHNATEIREIASLTKILTCIIVIEEVLRTRRTFQEMIQVPDFCTNIIGTKANLLPHDSLKLWDLLHGLMLPSGNDAALVLSDYIGKIFDPSNPIPAFIQKMNSLAKSLKMNVSSFSNPHGLSTNINLSSAKDVSVLVNYAMGNLVFRKIVARKDYTCKVQGTEGVRSVFWINTNRLLHKGCSGVKTGFTPNAGPCLACCAERGGRRVVVILLAAKSMNSRWNEARKLIKWAENEGELG